MHAGGLSSEHGWLSVNSQVLYLRAEPSHHHHVIKPCNAVQTRSFEDFPGLRAGKIDIIREMHDLHGFPNSSVSAIYCSHTLEHNSMDGIHTVLRGKVAAMLSI